MAVLTVDAVFVELVDALVMLFAVLVSPEDDPDVPDPEFDPDEESSVESTVVIIVVVEVKVKVVDVDVLF